MIQWTGNNLKEVIYFTGKSLRFEEWFKSWEEYENYVHSHNNILKLFCEDGSHYEVPIGAWIVKTPDGYNVPSVAKYIQQKQPKSICPRCVYRNKTDDICEYPYGGRDCLINENGVYKCNGFEEVEQQEQPHKSFCEENCKGYRDTGGKCFFGFDCSVKKAHEQEVDLEKALDEYYKIADFSPSDAIEYDTHKDIARHFYELGCRCTANMYDDIEYNRQKAEEIEQIKELEDGLEKEITDDSRACCNCVYGSVSYPICGCWQHKDCNTDEPYKIHKEDWLETAENCINFEMNARKKD